MYRSTYVPPFNQQGHDSSSSDLEADSEETSSDSTSSQPPEKVLNNY